MFSCLPDLSAHGGEQGQIVGFRASTLPA
eukprot:COSAG06_NODE_31952_length_513_cov_1.490338_2_plen_28_part_01